mgnify:CR=1 FL=1
MLKTRNNIVIILLFLLQIGYSQTTYYVDQQNGNDSNNGTSIATAFSSFDEASNQVMPGDTIEIIGEYANTSYNPTYSFGAVDDAQLWNGENTIKISGLNGAPGNYITIKAHDGNTVLKGDGANILRIVSSSYLIVEGFNIHGEVDNIPLSTANALQFVYIVNDANLQGSTTNPDSSDIKYRNEDETNDNDAIVEETDTYTDISNLNVIRPSYIDTRGLYATGCNNLVIKNNTIYNMPGGGLRVAQSSYVDILENEIYRCSAKSYSGTHALVVTETEPIGTNDYSVNILRNKVHHNYNEQFSWSPSKTIITPRIDEGKGISLQRNNTSNWINGTGRILVANNICYWNGFSGIHTNDGYRIDFINNTCYLNSYTNTITYPNEFPTEGQRGNNIGISAQSSTDVKMINNISVVDTDWGGFALAAGDSSGLVVSNNLIFGYNGTVNEDSDVTGVDVNTIISNPLFINEINFDFNLQSSSPAINSGNTTLAPTDDFNGAIRDLQPDLGALEHNGPVPTTYSFTDGIGWTPSNPSGVSTSIDNIHILSGNANSDNIGAPTIANNLTINSGAKLVINVDGALEVNTLDNQGTLTVRSNENQYGSFIPTSITNEGLLEYRLHVNSHTTSISNDLISAPFTGEKFGDFEQYSSNNYNIYEDPNNTSIKLFGPFNKTSATYIGYDVNNPTDYNTILEPGIGFRTGADPNSTNSTNIYVFKGNVNTGIVDVAIFNSGPSYQRWNLIGNPYPSYIDFATFYNTNFDQFDSGLYKAIWGYNATANKWTVWNNLTILNEDEIELIAPGQGFFVTSLNTLGNITFTPEMRRHGSTDNFITNRISSTTEMYKSTVFLNKNSNNYTTDIYFVNNASEGIDPGYDAAAFGNSSKGIFTNLVDGSSQEELAIQALPYNNISNMVVPLIIKANAGEQISIGLDATNTLPTNLSVYLEDNVTNTWTLLNTSHYTLTPSVNLNNTGRFFLHFTTSTLTINENLLSGVHIYSAINQKTIVIKGPLLENSILELFDIQGRLVMKSTLDQNNLANTVKVPEISPGLYMVKVGNDIYAKTQKVIIK